MSDPRFAQPLPLSNPRLESDSSTLAGSLDMKILESNNEDLAGSLNVLIFGPIVVGRRTNVIWRAKMINYFIFYRVESLWDALWLRKC